MEASLQLETYPPTKFLKSFHFFPKKWKYKSETGGNMLVKQVETYL